MQKKVFLNATVDTMRLILREKIALLRLRYKFALLVDITINEHTEIGA